MHICSLILSILSVSVCWMPFWAFIITLPSLIVSTVVFYKHFLGTKKEIQKGKALVFTAFVISILSFISSVIMAAVPAGIYLVSSVINVL